MRLELKRLWLAVKGFYDLYHIASTAEEGFEVQDTSFRLMTTEITQKTV